MIGIKSALLLGSSAIWLWSVPAIAWAQNSQPSPVQEEPPVSIDAEDIPTDDDVITVTAIRRSLESAQSVKQEADQIVDSVVAEDIGRLPDVTASESLARVTGVQVDRNGGTAQGVRIRGLPDLSTTYNGREVFTAEGRYVQLQDFPSNAIARLDVYKAASANLLEPGLAGLIDVRSRKPLDFKGDRIVGAITGLHYHQSQRQGIEANMLVSKRWDTGIGEMGFLIEGSYADIKFLDSSRNVSQTILNRTNVPGFIGTPVRVPSFVNINYEDANRWRPNGAAAFQWRPSATLEFYLDGLYQGYRSRGDNRNYQVLVGDASPLSNIELFEGTNQIRSVTATGGALPVGGKGAVDGSTDTYQAGGGFIWRNEGLKISGDAAFTDSTFTTQSFRLNFTTPTSPTRNFVFDNDGDFGGGSVTLSNYDLLSPANYRWTNINESGSRAHGQSIQARLDLDYKFGGPFLDSLQAGIRYSDRDAEGFNYARQSAAPAGSLFSLLPLGFEPSPRGFRGDDVDSIRVFLVPTRDSLVENADLLRALAGQSAAPDFVRTYTGNEKTYTGYVQGRYEFEVGTVPIDGLIGLRATRTENATTGLSRNGGVAAPEVVTRDTSYEDYLPNVSTRIRFLSNLQVRLAYTKTRTRPGFGQLNPTITIGTPPAICATDPGSPDCIRSASSGNPDLRPIESENFDASAEYFFSRSGSITVGAFRKNLQGFINNFVTDVPDAEFGRLRLSRPENGGDGRINGIEAAARTFFRAPWLPDWLGNFGGLVNYTYVDAKSELGGDLGESLPGFQRIGGVSKHLVNLSGFYDTRFVSTRLSYNYRSDFVTYARVVDPALGAGVIGPALPTTERGRGTLDLAATLSPNEHITFTFNATNLLGAASRNTRIFNADGQSYPFETQFLESVYRLGVRFRF